MSNLPYPMLCITVHAMVQETSAEDLDHLEGPFTGAQTEEYANILHHLAGECMNDLSVLLHFDRVL